MSFEFDVGFASLNKGTIAGVAQLAEHNVANVVVEGSNPFARSLIRVSRFWTWVSFEAACSETFSVALAYFAARLCFGRAFLSSFLWTAADETWETSTFSRSSFFS